MLDFSLRRDDTLGPDQGAVLIERHVFDALETSQRPLQLDLGAITQSLRSQKSARKSTVAKNAIKSLQKDVQLIDSLSKLLKRARSSLKTRLDILHTALAPVTLLPPETLRHIFQFLLDPIDKTNTTDDILNASQVSRYWRAVALDHSFLWTRIHAEWTIEQQNIWLKRSRHQPITLIALCSDAPRYTSSLVGLSSKLWEATLRWESLIILNFGVGDFHLLVSPALTSGRQLPSLRSVQLSAGHTVLDHDVGNTFRLDPDPYKLPCLEELSLHRVYIPSFHFENCGANLSSLELWEQIDRPAGLFVLLQNLPNLQRLVLGGLYLCQKDAPPLVLSTSSPNKHILQKLQHLSMTVQSFEYCFHALLFQCFAAPSLLELSLDIACTITSSWSFILQDSLRPVGEFVSTQV